MSFEQPLSTEKQEVSKALDEEWYTRFKEIGAFQAYEYFEDPSSARASEKKHFLAGEKENPDLHYPSLDLEQINVREERLLGLKDDVLAREKNEVIKNIYRWRINEKLAENRMLRAAALSDMRRFRRYSEFIYGKPSPEIFSHLLSVLRKDLERLKTNSSDNVRSEIDSFLAQLPDMPATDIGSIPEDIESEVQALANQEISDLIVLPEKNEGERYDAQDVQAAFEQALQKLEAVGWLVRIESGRAGINTNQEQKLVQIPEKQSRLAKSLQGIVLHEAGTHVRRRVNGERTRLKLLGLGLDRYEGGEEGIARMKEEALAGKSKDFADLAPHLAIGLARGVDGTPRDFRQTFKIMERYWYFQSLINGKSAEDARSRSGNDAWITTVRTFRGTDCKTPGVAFTKDIIYREGNIAVWEALEKNRPEMHRWNIGKYDPSNPRHIWVLDQLGITDKELENLKR